MILIILFLVLKCLVHTSVSNYVDVIERDVCIIGGGSSGTYAAIRLQEAGKSVMVIEIEKVLGGHSNTYVDPVTKQAVDYGVIIFENLPVVKKYFERLAVKFNYSTYSAPSIKYFDFSKGEIKNNVTVPDNKVALQAYLAELYKYPQLQDGFFLPNPVPADLLLPFGEFVTKYKIEEAVGIIWQFGQGIGDLLRQPTLYVFKYFGINVIQKDLLEGFILPEERNNLNIYSKALTLLKNNVLLESYPTRINRDNCNFVEVAVNTPAGPILIRSKKLLVTIAPKLNNLHGFDLNSHETEIFSQFKNTYYYTGLVQNTGLPANDLVTNINTNNPYGLPTLPALYDIQPTIINDLFDVKYCSLQFMTEEDVKADIIESILKLQRGGAATKTCKMPEFVAFNSHVPFQLTVSAEAIKNGFYDQLYCLQGKRNTFWTGATFQVHSSGLLWKYTDEIVIPLILKSLYSRS